MQFSNPWYNRTKWWLQAGLVPVLLFGLWSYSAHASDDPWPSLSREIFKDREIRDATDGIQLLAPQQADDAALVPISVRLSPTVIATIKSLTLVIDRNPAPVVGTFTFGAAFRDHIDIGERTIATRVRIDAFSRVRAVVETLSGDLFMVSKFVIGSGGCSAPASKDVEQALADLGKAQMKVFKSDRHPAHWRDGQIMIRHPNTTGMQMNAKSGDYTPARFIKTIEAKRGNEFLFRMEGGISLSEDPNIRFTFGAGDDAPLSFEAVDTEGLHVSARTTFDPS
ncbi:MAG: quinoprotein dehydrogenase-associated SoxYZ-like carrier [Hyphomicrobium sp.]|nr:MAG: quinoprotein dehydrogenase-associated SoxYZ-like carrier [Hyphomicrobium sp.]PPD00039.1 MAG: quinoprotein dehydrogenase-associated SoxYZ-like carrier [Hyphomicrobium sp.]